MLELREITKTYENKPLLAGVSLSVAAGETVCLLGASGSGKSTLLRMIAGLEQPEAGQILWDGQSLAGEPAHRRNFGLMFQDYALFPHLSVFENVAFGLRMQGKDRASRAGWLGRLQKGSGVESPGPGRGMRQRVMECLELVHLTGFEKRRVTELSGGEQQRVAMARALAPQPRLLMLDEPLGALDRALRETLLGELRHILHQTGIPAIYVTHDQGEAFTIADRVILLQAGRVVQAGTPPEVFAKPANAWVASFLGLGNLLVGQVRDGAVDSPFGRFQIQSTRAEGESVSLLLRPRAELASDGLISGVVSDVVFQGDSFRVELQGGLYFYLATAPTIGETVKLNAKVEIL